ncbi:hypothetical protein [Natrinema gelatinilyticum]|uniref:hypothetical protein n=1 Tax=Natrinema gelatinilyticum TaxID=2961571 RepID=UPI0020C2E61D|nr:hypothetical protein [Natrinema gelatinilyticum]
MCRRKGLSTVRTRTLESIRPLVSTERYRPAEPYLAVGVERACFVWKAQFVEGNRVTIRSVHVTAAGKSFDRELVSGFGDETEPDVSSDGRTYYSLDLLDGNT